MMRSTLCCLHYKQTMFHRKQPMTANKPALAPREQKSPVKVQTKDSQGNTD
jgi:hypothetical protein